MKWEVELEGLGEVWSTGDRVLDLEVSRGQGKQGSSVRVIIADPDHKIAERVINHTVKSGGIQELEQPDTAASTPSPGLSTAPGASVGNVKDRHQWELAIVKTALANGVTDQYQIAYLLGTAEHESDMGQVLVEQGSRSYFNYLEGRKDIGNIYPGDGYKYRGRGIAQLTGRISYANWGKRLNLDLIGNPDLATTPEVALKILVTGTRDGTITGRKMSTYLGNGKKDFYNARRAINGIVPSQMPKFLASCNKYLPKVPQLIAEVQGGSGATPPPKTDTSSVDTGNKGNSTSVATDTPVVKGNRIFVNVGDIGFEYFHQGTKALYNGRTELTGLGIGFELSRRQRNKTEGTKSLKGLAEKITKAHGAELEWRAPTDVNYTHIDQHGLSDYKLLERLCSQAGYFIRDEGKKVIISGIQNLVQTGIVLAPGLNLIKWEIEDKALTDEAEDAGRSLIQTEQKVEVNPATGTLDTKKPDIDKTKDKAATGVKTDTKQATVAPDSQVVAATQQARTKRMKGLPSVFTVPLHPTYLKLAPLDTVITEGLPGVLSRIWAIDKITHKVLDGETVIQVYSPVEVLDNNPTATATNPNEIQQPPASGGYIWPCSGVVTSTQNQIRSVGTSPHIGIDIGAPIGTPVYAPQDGVVNGFVGSGICINLRHPDGAVSRLMHLSERLVRMGQQVKRGELIGKVGATGFVTGAHLHWDIQGLKGNTYQTKGGTFNYTSAVGLRVPKKGETIKAKSSP